MTFDSRGQQTWVGPPDTNSAQAFEAEFMAEPPRTKLDEPIEVTIKLTIDRFEAGAVPRMFDNPRIQATRLTMNQGAALKALTNSLQGQHALMANGKHVDRTPDALRWLLDQVAEQILPQLQLQQLVA